jgi:hypothetical protein
MGTGILKLSGMETRVGHRYCGVYWDRDISDFTGMGTGPMNSSFWRPELVIGHKFT